ncbi:Panacea domain-containing protein [Shewanella sp. Arc9-LZ]|uniref:Panacea domain-containing protein n=1 Tax=Shewanella sp. Arc9-LZ TaxID=2698686 RepID=UPI00137BC04B|nr:type II toxin-antitoxin system antitoxin SocA domain-containing protein [Shewanella sp. Arc9-LZ]QHS12041.1 DUF4065 domain-containing protein [Shewanella sp. Arc9-LZ]
MSDITFQDVAKYILEKKGDMSAMKLQKLMYYSQAWSLVWDEACLFDDDFEAWANGPVLKPLYNLHRGQFKVSSEIVSGGNTDKLSQEQVDSIDKVLDFFGSKTAQWLSDLTHKEQPWIIAREGLEPMQTSSNIITKGSMDEYYSAL